MTKKNLIALADAIRQHQKLVNIDQFQTDQLYTLADFCKSQNPQFNRERWLDYIAGKCGKNGGKI